MLIGYARVSTREPDPAYQRAQLEQAGCERIYIESASGAQRDRPQLGEALQYTREDDVLVLPRLDRLARSLCQGRVGGRPRVMSDEDIEQAKTLIHHSDLPVAEIARRLSVSRTALYRAFPGGRSGITSA